MALYNPNAYLFNDNVYTKFAYILFIHSQDIEQKPNSNNQSRAVTQFYNPNINLVNKNVYTKSSLNLSIPS